MPERPECSIVMPAYNRAGLTRRCLDTLLADPPAVSHEILVVDDASTDGTPRLLAGYGAPVRPVYRDVNDGFAAACNDGVARASGRWLLFLNNDTLPTAGWLDALVDYAEANPAATVVGAKLLFPNDTVQHAGVAICQDGYPRHLYAGFPAAHPAVNRARRFQAVTAACALVRREAYEAVGGFDPAFRNGFEDVDLCLRLGQGGHEVHYCPRSVVYHLESLSEGRFERDRENARLYRERWAHRVRPDDVSYYLADGLLRVRYESAYPIRLEVSPQLALVESDLRTHQADRLLGFRSRQVFDLLRETARLTAQVAELQLGSADGAENGRADGAGGNAGTGSGGLSRLRDGGNGGPSGAASPAAGRDELRERLLEVQEALLDRDEGIESTIYALQVAMAEQAAGSPGKASPGGDGLAGGFAPSSYLGYRETIRRIRKLVRRTLPEGATVLVVTRGDPELLTLGRVRALHFPRTEEDEYAGQYPQDSAEAVVRLERLREQGAEYLLFPNTAFWWLEHYSGLREHLEARCRSLVPEGEPCRIYELAATAGVRARASASSGPKAP